MSTQASQFTGAAEQVKANVAGRMEVGWDLALPGGAFHPARSRRTRGVVLALTLVCLLVMKALAPAEAVLPVTPAATPAAPGDEYWAAGYNLPGMTGTIIALAVGRDGSLYAGGWFSAAGGVAANFIARWDGSQWQPLGSGLGGMAVSALAFGPDGSLYAGGRFWTAGGVAAKFIARWDGSQWHPLGSGMDYFVYALAMGPDGSLYAGGNFATAGGVAANFIARWDGSQWHPLGSGMGGGEGGHPSCYGPYVTALAVGPDGSLYAGGCFTTAGGVAANHIARWDAATSSWHPLGSGMSWNVYALALGPDGSLYAGGYFNTAGGVAANHIARWDAATSSWHPLGSGISGSVSALAVGPNGSVYAGGYFATAGEVAANSIARWDGSQWHPLGSGVTGGGVSALVFGQDGSLYTGGDFTTAGGKPSSYIAQWTGAILRPAIWFPVVLMEQ